MKRPPDVLEHNLRRLLRQSYVPALPAPHFRDRLESLFLAEVARHRSARRAVPARAWPRWTLAAAAGILALFLGREWLAPAARSTREGLFARGEVALSTADGAWRAAGAEERARGVRFTTPRLVAVTPAAAELEILVAGGRVHLAERTELELVDGGSGPAATLCAGAAWFLDSGARRLDLVPLVRQPLLAAPPESGALASSKPGAGLESTREAQATTTSPARAADAPGARVLHGQVVAAEDGAPLAEFEVGLLTERVNNQTPPPVRRAFADAAGEFRWPDPPAGKQRVFVYAPGFALCQLGEYDLSGEMPALRAELVRGVSVHGGVFDGLGDPVPNALILSERDVPSDGLLFAEDGGYFWLPVQARSGPDGRFELAHLTPGVHTLRASAAGHAPAWQNDVRLPGAAGEELEFALGAGGTIAGRVTREDGGPWADAMVVVVAMDQVARMRQSFGFALTDADGRYRFEHLPPETMVVVLVRSDARPDARPVQVTEDQTVTANFAATRRGITLHGRVLDGDGRPIANRNLGLFDKLTSSWSQDWIASATQADGAYTFYGVPPRPYQLFLIDDKGRGLRCVDELELAADVLDVEHDVRVPHGRLEVHVRAAESGAPVENSALIVLRVEPDGHRSFSAFGSTDARGLCELVDQRPGTYIVSAYPLQAGLGFAESAPLQLDEDRPAVLELVHEPGGAVDVLVRDPEGHGLEGAAVSFRDETGEEHQFSRVPLTDASGRYHAQGLRPGRYRAYASLAGHQGAPVDFRFELGRVLEVPVVLTPAAPR